MRAVLSHLARAERYDAGAVGHWVGEKVAIGTNCAKCCDSDTSSMGRVPPNRLHHHDFVLSLPSGPARPLMHRGCCQVFRAEAAAVNAIASGSQHSTMRAISHRMARSLSVSVPISSAT